MSFHFKNMVVIPIKPIQNNLFLRTQPIFAPTYSIFPNSVNHAFQGKIASTTLPYGNLFFSHTIHVFITC